MQCWDVLASACVALYLAARVCKFLHVCVASYMHVHASNVRFPRMFLCLLCACHTPVPHMWTLCYVHAWTV